MEGILAAILHCRLLYLHPVAKPCRRAGRPAVNNESAATIPGCLLHSGSRRLDQETSSGSPDFESTFLVSCYSIVFLF